MGDTFEQRNGFGKLLREHRKAAGFSQEELAERAGMSANGLGELERGKKRRPFPKTVRALADALSLEGEARAAFFAAAEPPIDREPAGAGASHVGGTPAPRHLLGRECELADLKKLLTGEARLITLTGPGGIGKTSLVGCLAAEVAQCFPDGIVFVDLTSLRDSELVAPAVARALGVMDGGGDALEIRLTRAIRDRALLLVLDNCEQVAAGVARLISLLVSDTTHLVVLATSRVPLNLAIEQVYPVAPLPLPAAQSSLAEANESPAVALFVQRARQVDPSFALTHENVADVIAICTRLDGVPLAIDLAARKIPVFPPAALLARLLRRLPLLTGGPVDLPDRQRTMRSTIAWSVELLSDREQQAFRRLAVFTSGIPLEGAEAVLRGIDDEAIALVFALTWASLLRRIDPPNDARYGMLETIHEYALEELIRSGEEEETRALHAAYFLKRAEQAADDLLWGRNQRAWHEWFAREQPNLRAALEWLVETGAAEPAQRMVGALGWAWMVSGHPRSGLELFERASALGGDIPAGVRASALLGLAALRFALGEFAAMRLLADEALSLARAADDQFLTTLALISVGVATGGGPQPQNSIPFHEEAARLAQEIGNDWLLALALTDLGDALRGRGELLRAAETLAQGLVAFYGLDDPWGIPFAFGCLATLALESGESEEARRILGEMIVAAVRFGDPLSQVAVIAISACVAVAYRRPFDAARLLGAATRQGTLRGWTEISQAANRMRRIEDAIRADLSPAEFDAATAEGAAWSLDEAMAAVRAFFSTTADQAGSLATPAGNVHHPASGTGRSGRARMVDTLRVMIEIGPKGKRVVAVAPDWPGCSRGAKTEEAAIERLLAYRARYARVAELAGMAADFPVDVTEVEVAERYPGTPSTDFWGISFAHNSFDRQAMTDAELERELALMRAAWAHMDEVRGRLPEELLHGPRGGGWNRDLAVRHTVANEIDWAKKLKLRMFETARLSEDELTAHRDAYTEAIRDFHTRGEQARTWPLRYLIRHTAYHTLDHTWDMADRDPTARPV